jgi:hypothetical protein
MDDDHPFELIDEALERERLRTQWVLASSMSCGVSGCSWVPHSRGSLLDASRSFSGCADREPGTNVRHRLCLARAILLGRL